MKLNMLKPRLKEVDLSRGIKTIEQHMRSYPAKTVRRWTKDDNGRTLPLTSAAWRKLRRYVLAGEPLCRHCAAQGLTVPATEVDHMHGAADNRIESLQALCKPCHSIKTMAELYGRPARSGCDASGMPTDPSHPWNKAPVGRPDASALPSCVSPLEKSPPTERRIPTSSHHANPNCESQP